MNNVQGCLRIGVFSDSGHDPSRFVYLGIYDGLGGKEEHDIRMTIPLVFISQGWATTPARKRILPCFFLFQSRYTYLSYYGHGNGLCN